MYCVYVLQSKTYKSFYVGCTNDINRRLFEHNKGLSRYTKNKAPWVLKYSEDFSDLKTARRREMQIKSWKDRKALERLIVTRPHRLAA